MLSMKINDNNIWMKPKSIFFLNKIGTVIYYTVYVIVYNTWVHNNIFINLKTCNNRFLSQYSV